MLKNAGVTVEALLLDVYNNIISPSASPPESWKKSAVTVFRTAGDVADANNYRPITIIPLLYKLFAKLLYHRVCPILDKHQNMDQAGFRKGLSTVHH
eukprot:205708-Pyramimonas_sp.AAC.1